MRELPIYLIDGNFSSSEVLAEFFTSKGIRVIHHSSLEEFLAGGPAGKRGCIILDMQMTGIGVEEVQERLIASNIILPSIFLVSVIGIPAVVRIMKRGAHYLMVKPLDMQLLLVQVREALKLQAGRRRHEMQQETTRMRISRLTDRERTILSLALAGKQNKEIAQLLNISHRTVEAHRSHILAKTGASNLLELMGVVIEIEHSEHTLTAP